MIEQSERGEKLAEDDLQIRYRRSHQQFHRPTAALFGINAHGQHGREKEQKRGENAEEIAHHQGRNVESRSSSELPFLKAGLERFLDNQDQQPVEEIGSQNKENGDNDISHGRDEVVAHLLAVNGVHSFHGFVLSLKWLQRVRNLPW